MIRRKPIHGRKSVVVRLSPELIEYVKQFAEPLVDDFETALWKALDKSFTRSNLVRKEE